MARHRNRTGKAISDEDPLVSDVGRAAALLKVGERELLVAIRQARLEVWGRHAQGMEVYRYGELRQACADAGLPIPDRKGHGWRRRPAVIPSRTQP